MIIIAHRGFSKKFPENTILSIKESVKLGLKFVEVDVSLTKENIPILIHDETLDRTTSLKGRVSSVSFDELIKTDAGSWKGKNFKDEKIPSLEKVLEYISTLKDVTLNLEIKKECYKKKLNGVSIETHILDLLKKYKLKNRVIISSFKFEILQEFRKLDSNLKISILPMDNEIYSGKVSQYIEKIKPHSVNFSLEVISSLLYKDKISEKQIDYLRELFLSLRIQKKIKIFIYTVNNPKQIELLKSFGVHGIFTDEPDLFLE